MKGASVDGTPVDEDTVTDLAVVPDADHAWLQERSATQAHSRDSSVTDGPLGDILDDIDSLSADVGTIVRSSRVMAAIVDDMLDYAKMRR